MYSARVPDRTCRHVLLWSRAVSIRLSSVELTSGDRIQVANGVTAIVGPNNSGKSLTLREILDYLQRGNSLPLRNAVKNLQIDYQGSAHEFYERLRRFYSSKGAGQYGYGTFTEEHVYANGSPITQSQIANAWGQNGGISQIANTICLYLDAASRLTLVGNGGIYDVHLQGPSSIPQRVYASRELEERISQLTMRAFGAPFTVNRYGGGTINLHLGKVSTPETLPPSSAEYLTEINALPYWQDQGDGMRAFLGIALSVVTSDCPLILIDEPEAFLHPPQARILGRVLTELRARDSQIIVATHSSDIIDGITSAADAPTEVSIARLTRPESNSNRVAQVSAETIRELYDDPLIKHYNILDGLFSTGVVLCEADSDCTYYRAVLGTIEKLGNGVSAESISPHFAHCGGKARLPKAVKALKSANVPVVCAVDLDLLQNDSEFEALVTAFGGSPADYTAWRNDITSAVMQYSKRPSRVAARAVVNAIFDAKTSAELTSAEIGKIRDAVTGISGWKEAKKHGRGFFSGQAVSSFDKLDEMLRTLGIYLVREGELERFHPGISADNKSVWLRQVLETGRYRESEQARAYIEALVLGIYARQ